MSENSSNMVPLNFFHSKQLINFLLPNMLLLLTKKSLNAPFIYLSRYQKCLAWIPNTSHKQWPFVTRSPITFMSVHQQRRTMRLQSLQTSMLCVFLFFLGCPRANFKSRSAGVCFRSRKKTKSGLHTRCAAVDSQPAPSTPRQKPHVRVGTWLRWTSDCWNSSVLM